MLICKAGRVYRTSVLNYTPYPPPKINYPIHLIVNLYPPDKRIRDIDNFDGKALYDSLTFGGVIEDDSFIKSRTTFWQDPDKKNPRVEITIIPQDSIDVTEYKQVTDKLANKYI